MFCLKYPLVKFYQQLSTNSHRNLTFFFFFFFFYKTRPRFLENSRFEVRSSGKILTNSCSSWPPRLPEKRPLALPGARRRKFVDRPCSAFAPVTKLGVPLRGGPSTLTIMDNARKCELKPSAGFVQYCTWGYPMKTKVAECL